ncbi:unnamed protein product [Leuciscus chuanchicus]
MNVIVGPDKELAEAHRKFATLESSDRKFQSLVHYGMGRVYLKENRFAKALERFSNAQLMIQRHVTPGKLTWPTTKTIVEETQTACLKERLQRFVELCKFPPKADAVCRHQHCLAHTIHIYFSDPDFKGFIQLICCQSCRVEFHMSCWKKLKTLSFSDKNDKDFLKDLCFTPDCGGRICHVVIFGSTGLIKCEFKTCIPKLSPAGRARVRQPCSSIKKLKSKNDRKLRRKQQKLARRSVCGERDEVTAEDAANKLAVERRSPPPRDSIYVDRVLHQIHDNKGLFKEEPVNISVFWEHLRPWLDLCESKEQASVVNGRRDTGSLSELADLLLESRNRVWARVFIHTLACGLHITPRLQQWAQHLDNAGLRAAQSFISRYSAHLEELDLKPLLVFTPLHDTLQKYATVSELFDRDGFTVMEYLRQAPAKEMRLLIWTLESNRERYHSSHSILDQYFEDDAVCLVIKKMDDEEHMSSIFKSKNRHRKKKQKELKSVIVLSGMRGHSRDEDEEDELFSEEDSLLFLSGVDPFSVPEHLRGQLAEFEEQYAGSAHRSHYERILDNHPDPTKESLYDYFAQILEEHGPLCASDPLMVGELENFPPEAQQKISDAGGLKLFLLESLRFTMTEELIGLMKHAVSLTDSGPSHLNPSAREFWPHADALSDEIVQISLGSYDNRDEPLSSDPFPIFPDPYDSECPITDYEYLAADMLDTEEHVCDAVKTREHKQTGVCVRGDLMQKEKQKQQLLKKLQQMKEDHAAVQQKRTEEISALQEETQRITQSKQIASAELAMFQQKLEEEVRKDQLEKKENQETLKNLKMEIKDLTDLHERSDTHSET